MASSTPQLHSLPPTRYRVPPATNPGDASDITTFVPDQADWALNSLPPIMGQIEKLPDQSSTLPVPRLMRGGQQVIGNQGRPLRDFTGYLPDQICTKVEGWRLACWLSVDDRCHLHDVLDRMKPCSLTPKDLSQRIWYNFRNKLRQPQHHQNRFRRQKITKLDIMVLDKLTPEQIRHNTIWNVTSQGMVQPGHPQESQPEIAAHPFIMRSSNGGGIHVPGYRLWRTINKLRRVRRTATSIGLMDWKNMTDSDIDQVDDSDEDSDVDASSDVIVETYGRESGSGVIAPMNTGDQGFSGDNHASRLSAHPQRRVLANMKKASSCTDLPNSFSVNSNLDPQIFQTSWTNQVSPTSIQPPMEDIPKFINGRLIKGKTAGAAQAARPRSASHPPEKRKIFEDFYDGFGSGGVRLSIPGNPDIPRFPALPTNELNPHKSLWYEPSRNPFIGQDGNWIIPRLYGVLYWEDGERPPSNLNYEQWMLSVGASRYYGLVEQNPDIEWSEARDVLKAGWDAYSMAL